MPGLEGLDRRPQFWGVLGGGTTIWIGDPKFGVVLEVSGGWCPQIGQMLGGESPVFIWFLL